MNDPPFQEPETKGRGTPTRKARFKIVLSNIGCPTRPFLELRKRREWLGTDRFRRLMAAKRRGKVKETDNVKSKVKQKLKLRVARKLRKRGKAGVRGADAIAVWGDGRRAAGVLAGRFYDFNVYSKGKKKEKLNYMHANPVIRRLSKYAKDWAWSSWGFYYGGGGG